MLATELLNRSRRGAANVVSAALGAGAAFVLMLVVIAYLPAHPHNFDDHVFLAIAVLALGFSAVAAWILKPRVLVSFLGRGSA